MSEQERVARSTQMMAVMAFVAFNHLMIAATEGGKSASLVDAKKTAAIADRTWVVRAEIAGLDTGRLPAHYYVLPNFSRS